MSDKETSHKETSEKEKMALLTEAMGAYTTGVTVVTTLHEAEGKSENIGMTCNSFATVSLNPPMVMWCIRRESASHAAFATLAPGAGYVVNVLAENQLDTAMKFTRGTQAQRFEGTDVHKTRSGRARLGGALAWFDCTLTQVIPAGDHDILIGTIVEYRKETIFEGNIAIQG